MHIERMKVRRFRLIRDFEFGPFHEPADYSELIVLAGPNGSGKSSILELLSYGLTSRYSWQYYQSRHMTEHSFAIKVGLTQEEIGAIESALVNDSVLEYVRRQRGYWMEVNMPEAIDSTEIVINQQLHGIVSQQFQKFTRKLGFFLRPDRGYGARNYDQKLLFNWKNRLTPQHFSRISYAQSNQQYEDMYDFLVEQSYHHIYDLGMYQKYIESGEAASRPEDPLRPYNDLLGRLFPGYAFVDTSTNKLVLQVRLPTGDIVPFQDLSSGEKEVFFILSFFIRHAITYSVIVIDEPDLHLHPELARRLVDLMRKIKPGNQIWCATHSAELIDEAGRARTFFLRISENRQQCICRPAAEDGAETEILRDLFGYSGYVGISKKVVFTEGETASADRKTFSQVLPSLSDQIRIIPVGGHQNLYRINRAVLSLLESDFARCQFFLIRDRDYSSEAALVKYRQLAPGHLFVLSRYHIENYLLDDELIASVLNRVYQRQVEPTTVCEDLRRIARENSAAFLRNMVEHRYGELFQAEDCSVGNHSSNLAIMTGAGDLATEVIDPLRVVLIENATRVGENAKGRIETGNLETIFQECLDEVIAALRPDSETWRILLPGRPILQKFSSSHNLGKWPALQNLLIEELARGEVSLNNELREILETIGNA